MKFVIPICGSSPRVRGTPETAPQDRRPRRFIPACAGNTRRTVRQWFQPTVHPRVCGEHGAIGIEVCVPNGSSPRVRGTRHRRPLWGRCQRFIPACAGNTRAGPAGADLEPVHPRVCGEHGLRRGLSRPRGGSSPRVRGTQERHPSRRRGFRFIPACAGNTPRESVPRNRSTVHPRVCGEHNLAVGEKDRKTGSSPRVRGTLRKDERVRHLQRFIPACAGNTAVGRFAAAAKSVHPRVCGEHFHPVVRRGNSRGSSPRVRGTRPGSLDDGGRDRFIPACAGNTSTCHGKTARPPVHPRVCGEHTVAKVP